MNCKHSNPRWNLADCNEDGWQCADCDGRLGFRPDLDREHIDEKIDTILFWLVEHEFLYVSNATEGAGLVQSVAFQCRSVGAYDQQFIIYHLAAQGLPSHIAFWRKQSEQHMCIHASRTLVGDIARCITCGHEVKQAGDGALFAACRVSKPTKEATHGAASNAEASASDPLADERTTSTS